MWDCPGQEGEVGCDAYQCSGYYRSHSSGVCLSPDYVCDGMAHCPLRDDELLCEFVCPTGCKCHGLAFFCSQRVSAESYLQLRYLNAAGSGMTPSMLTANAMLVYLRLADCQLVRLQPLSLPNLHSLDLSMNSTKHITADALLSVVSLRVLILSDNPLAAPVLKGNVTFTDLIYLDLSNTQLKQLNSSPGDVLHNLQTLNLSHTGLTDAGKGFSQHQQLQVLDLRGCPLTRSLVLYSKAWASCRQCTATSANCAARRRFQLVSTWTSALLLQTRSLLAGALLLSDVYRVVLSIMAVVSILANLASLVFRVLLLNNAHISGFATLVTHLCIADLFMGIS